MKYHNPITARSTVETNAAVAVPGADESLEHAVAEVLRASTEQPENGRKRRVDPQTAETLKSLGYLQ